MLKFDSRNFDAEALKTLWKLAQSAEFIALDCEFSCVRLNLGRCPQQDKIYQEYKKIVENASLLEVGLTFVLNDALKGTEAVTCSFHIFNNTIGSCHTFSSEKESIAFLAKSNFDFNSCFKYGLSFSRTEDDLFDLLGLIKLQEQTDPIHDIQPFKKTNYPSKEMEKIEESLKEHIDNFVSDKSKPVLVLSHLLKEQLDFVTSIDCDILPKMIAHDVTFVKRNGVLSLFKSKPNLDTIFKFSFMKYGLSLLFWYFSVKNKKLIFHHGLLDYMYIFSNFMGPLPKTLSEFIEASTKLKWHIFDTKLISGRLAPTEKNDLSSLYARWRLRSASAKAVTLVTQNYFADLPNLFGHIAHLDAGNPESHGAGPDSYMTAMAFFALQNAEPNTVDRYKGAFWDKFNWKFQSFIVTNYYRSVYSFYLAFSQESDFERALELLQKIGDFSVQKERDGTHKIIYSKSFKYIPSEVAQIGELGVFHAFSF